MSIAQIAGGKFRQEEVCGKTKEEKERDGQDTHDEFPVDLKPDVATLRANTNNIQ